MQEDFFGNQRVRIPDNRPLEKAAALILEVVASEPGILDGATVGEIDRSLQCAIWLMQGLGAILGENVEEFKKWFAGNSVDGDLVRRARRYLVEHDHIRISAEAVRAAERQRARLTGTFGPRR